MTAPTAWLTSSGSTSARGGDPASSTRPTTAPAPSHATTAYASVNVNRGLSRFTWNPPLTPMAIFDGDAPSHPAPSALASAPAPPPYLLLMLFVMTRRRARRRRPFLAGGARRRRAGHGRGGGAAAAGLSPAAADAQTARLPDGAAAEGRTARRRRASRTSPAASTRSRRRSSTSCWTRKQRSAPRPRPRGIGQRRAEPRRTARTEPEHRAA